MGKKSKRNRSKATTAPDESRYAPPLRSGNEPETPDNLQFADPFVEEYVEEDIIDDNCKPPAAEDDNCLVGDGPSEIVQAWNPLTGDTGDELEMDPSAYKMHHALTPEWPCLSFDFLRDDHGDQRTRFPHTLIAAIGTQAARADQNQLTLLRISDMAKMQVETEDDILGEELHRDGDDDDDDDDDSSSDEEVDLDPVMEHYSIPHRGGVNRVRVMPQNADIVATWSDAGAVNLFNVASIRQRFSVGYCSSASSAPPLDIPSKPFFSYTKHATEGFAIDWSPAKQGHLVTGDCDGSIHCWSPRPEGGYAVSPFYKNSDIVDAPSNSVEDLQWSPTEATVFSSAECNGYVRIFDTRAPNKAMLSHQIHAADVNVLSWNHIVSNLLATGGDDGTLAVWDLRHFKSKPTPLARFTPHKSPISSVEWHPVDESMLAATDDAGAYIYDLSVEEDDIAMATDENPDIPPQLLFVHCGSEQFKEVHWHPQISSCLMSTALTGFSVFIPSNL